MSNGNPLDQYYSEAVDFVTQSSSLLDFRTVILDDWAGIRLIYETEDVLACDNACEKCRTFLELGEDADESGGVLRTTLTKSSSAHTDISKYRMLNCKRVEDYLDSFSEWMITRCFDLEGFVEELTLIRNFRIVFSRHHATNVELGELKRKLVDSVLQKTRRGITGPRKDILEQAIAKVF